MSRRFSLLCLGVLLILAAVVRFHKYAEFPVVGETADEYAWTMLGASLIETGEPASWSQFDAYKDNQVTDVVMKNPQTGARFPIVRPVFDHPPLFGLVPGFAQAIRGEWSVAPSAKVIRLPVIFFGILNVLLLYLISKHFFKEPLAQFVPAVIYATAPLFVFSSRLVVAENMLSTLTLLVIYLLVGMKASKKQFWLLVLVSAAAVLTKMSGVAIPVAIIAYGWSQKQDAWKAGILGLILGFVAFMLYGAFFNWELFVNVFSTQAGRNIGLATLHTRLFLHPAIVDKFYVDGWLIAGLAATVLVFFKAPKQFLSVKLFFLSTLMFIFFFVGEQTFHGWYDFQYYPLLCLCLGYVVVEMLRDKNYLLLGLLWIMLLPMLRFGLMSTNLYYLLSPWAMRTVMALGFVPWVLQQLPVKPTLPQWAAAAILSIVVIGNVVAVLTFQKELYWRADDYFIFRGYIYPDTQPKE